MEKRELKTIDYIVETKKGVRYCAFLVAEDEDFYLSEKMKKDKGENLDQDMFFTRVVLWRGQTKPFDACQFSNCKKCEKFKDYGSRFSDIGSSLESVD